MVIDLPPPQIECVAKAIYHEARGESDKGKRAVGHVILNRSKNKGITPCEVIYQPRQFTGIKSRVSYSGPMWERAKEIARTIQDYSDPTFGAVSFHNTRSWPNWKGLIRTVTIGNHVFYKRR